MASGNTMKEKMAQTTSRQKLIIGVMAAVVLIIIWQIMGLLGGGSSESPPTIQPKPKMDASKPGGGGANGNVSGPQSSSGSSPDASTTDPQAGTALKQATIVNDPQFNRLQRITEEKFVGKLNELEELRIQRQIAETNQAITAAKLATVTAEKDISDLLTRPTPGSFAAPSFAAVNSTMAAPVEGAPPATPVVVRQDVAPYKLVSVSMLLNKWNAVVGLEGTMFSVGVGDTLSPDGSVVTNINKSSVMLKKDGKSRRVSITSSM